MTDSKLPDLPIYVDSTMLTSFKSCPRKYLYAHLHNLRGAGKSVHLVAGGAFAAGLEAAREAAFSASHILTPDEISEAAFGPFMAEWGDYEAPEDSPKSLVNTFDALEGYLHAHHPQLDPIQPMRKPDGSPNIEYSFAIPLPVKHPSGDNFIFTGRFDMLGIWNDLPCIVDEKTTSALGNFWLKQFDLRGQFIGYCWACSQLGIPVNHVFVRGIAIKKTGCDFLTAPLQFPNHLLERWFDNTCRTLESLVAHWEAGLFTYNFGDSCAAYGGCTYTPLCAAKNDLDWFSQYEVSVWNPLRATGELAT